MAQVSLPYTLTAGTPENVNNLVANLNALVAGVNTIDTAQLASGAVTNAKTNFTWTNYTPTFTNFTLGNGSVSAQYCQIGKVVFYMGTLTLGSTSAFTGAIIPSLPVGVKVNQGRVVGTVQSVDASDGYKRYVGVANTDSQVWNGVGLIANGGSGIDATFPFTFANGDSISWSITYEAA